MKPPTVKPPTVFYYERFLKTRFMPLITITMQNITFSSFDIQKCKVWNTECDKTFFNIKLCGEKPYLCHICKKNHLNPK